MQRAVLLERRVHTAVSGDCINDVCAPWSCHACPSNEFMSSARRQPWGTLGGAPPNYDQSECRTSAATPDALAATDGKTVFATDGKTVFAGQLRRAPGTPRTGWGAVHV